MTPSQRLPAALGPAAAVTPTRFGREIPVSDDLVRRLAQVCSEITTDDTARVAAGRDWWPLSTLWAVGGVSPALPAAVAFPANTAEVGAVLASCNEAGVPVTVVAGASGVCGGSIPLFGGVSMDLVRLEGVVAVDDDSLLVDVRAGTFGDHFEQTLQSEHSVTVGHWPQSIALSTVGGWIACRGAGQYSTRYGKIEDMVVGLEVVLADGRVIRTGGTAPRSATGPDLTQLFVGSEGTLGVVTEARLRCHPKPPAEERAVYGFAGFEDGLDACRRILRRGATPAVLRLYDHPESARNFEVDGQAVLVVIDEGDPMLVGSVMAVVDEECDRRLDTELAGHWLEHRNSVPPIESLVRAGIVADTVEVAGSWSALPAIYRGAIEALHGIEDTLAASAHQSHSYPDGGCLYFTFAGRPGGGGGDESGGRDGRAAVMHAATRAGGAISHHHGIGLNRSRYMRDHLGPAFETLTSLKSALDPRGILNPGKLGLPSPFDADLSHPATPYGGAA
jgi:alkyldihydroxyacetonephosphate synthase